MAEKIGEAEYKYANYHFRWTNLHIPKGQMLPLQYEYDQLGSSVVEKLQNISQKQKQDGYEAASDMYTLLRDHHNEDPVLQTFWDEVHTVPDWVDWDQVARGQKFFYRYAMANIVGFALQGFVGENTASASVVEILVRTGGFSIKTLRRRLLSTFQFILQVSESLESLHAGGAGHTSAIRVRLLHAAVRNRITKLAGTNPDYFDIENLGTPVNALDSIHSIATFCCNHMWLQLPQMGVYPREQEITDYIALYRYVAYLLGTHHNYFESTAKAKATMESMLVNELRLTPTSEIVCHNFVEFLKDLPPFNISAEFIEAGSRKLNGDNFCNALGMGKPGWYAYACFQGLCWLLRALAFLQQKSKKLDSKISTWFQQQLHNAIIYSKDGLSGGSKMRFKYIPQLNKYTGKESASWHSGELYFFQRPVELFSFGFFILTCLSVPGLLWILWQIRGLLHESIAPCVTNVQ
jgi:hypothetical protein